MSETYNTIAIPNLDETPYCIKEQTLNNKVYYFEYIWNNRDGAAYLSIYLLINSNKVYLVRGIRLVYDCELSKNIINDNWAGYLYFTGISLGVSGNYTQQNISTDYQLIYRVS